MRVVTDWLYGGGHAKRLPTEAVGVAAGTVRMVAGAAWGAAGAVRTVVGVVRMGT